MGRKSPYPDEFRAEAVRLVLDAGRSVKDVAESLGMRQPETLRKWVNKEKVARGLASGVKPAELEELKALRKENRELQQQVEILEKATAFFVSRGLGARK